MKNKSKNKKGERISVEIKQMGVCNKTFYTTLYELYLGACL
jgi:hypothetical protein